MIMCHLLSGHTAVSSLGFVAMVAALKSIRERSIH
jgi:hypothetical protein